MHGENEQIFPPFKKLDSTFIIKIIFNDLYNLYKIQIFINLALKHNNLNHHLLKLFWHI